MHFQYAMLPRVVAILQLEIDFGMRQPKFLVSRAGLKKASEPGKEI